MSDTIYIIPIDKEFIKILKYYCIQYVEHKNYIIFNDINQEIMHYINVHDIELLSNNKTDIHTLFTVL